MRDRVDKMLEKTIGKLIGIYLRRKLRQALKIINSGGHVNMKVVSSIGEFSISCTIREMRTSFTQPTEGQPSSTPVENTPFEGRIFLKESKSETEMQVEELKEILQSGERCIDSFRDKIATPLINMFGETLKEAREFSKEHFGKRLDKDLQEPDNDTITVLQAKVAVLEEQIKHVQQP